MLSGENPLGFGPEAEGYDSRSQHDVYRWIASCMVCSIIDTTLNDGTITVKNFHPGWSIRDGNEIAWDPYTRPWVGSPTNPCAAAKFVSRDENFEIGQEKSTGGARESMVHKMQRPRAWQGPLSSVHKLLGRGRANAIKTRGTGQGECSVCIMVRDLPNRRKTYHGYFICYRSIRRHPNNCFIIFASW